MIRGIFRLRAIALSTLSCVVLAVVPLCARADAAGVGRRDVLLNLNWRTVADDADATRFPGFEKVDYNDGAWSTVDVPHNWDAYEGDRRLVHGDRHGYAWYRRVVTIDETERGRRLFLYFEGVGSYATVWLNGQEIGRHAGGRTTFTLEITHAARVGATNILAVRADHPDGIRDLPWVCGGSSPTPGFSEGSQPMGIFRPVHLVSSGPARILPFGVHVWNGDDASAAAARVQIETQYDSTADASLQVRTRLLDATGHEVIRAIVDAPSRAEAGGEVHQDLPEIAHPHLWSLADPYLYTVETTLWERGVIQDRLVTPFGIRTVRWPAVAGAQKTPVGGDGRFFLNGQPVFINGVAEYEHLLGNSHAFSDAQVRARALQVKAAGFNAFRDAHQPHNLRYQEYWDQLGVLWWPQFVAQIWFDTPAFRENFKTLLRDWVKERRNSPSLVLWGLANESKLPPAFAAECAAIIRELDPTATTQRKIVTCNGNGGADWSVPQNWSGTYGGDPNIYADDLRRQLLVGEYGAWRSLELHTDGGFARNGLLSEDRMAGLLELKIRQAESARDAACGHFLWLLASHENPGRIAGPAGQQRADGIRQLDQVGPANNKGLYTLWGEPTDAYDLYRSNYTSAKTAPMVAIVSHTWPRRWSAPGKKSGIVVYSNCDEVELYNDVKSKSLGRRVRQGIGTHFQWDDVPIETNVLYAEGRRDGKVVATDSIVLEGLPVAPHRRSLNGPVANLTAPAARMYYLYRVNAGGGDYRDQSGNLWSADAEYTSGDTWGSVSWAQSFAGIPGELGSQRVNHDAVRGTLDDPLFQSYRYGREQLSYRFAVPPGQYEVELYFAEPWYGRGGGVNCTGWRLFDIAINGTTVTRDLDLWKAAGYSGAVKRVYTAQAARNGELVISFPRVSVGQAVISAIAIATADASARAPAQKPRPVSARLDLQRSVAGAAPSTAPVVTYAVKEARLRGARLDASNLARSTAADAYIEWTVTLGVGGPHDISFVYQAASPGVDATSDLTIVGSDGSLVDAENVHFRGQPGTDINARAVVPGIELNADTYHIRLSLPSAAVALHALQMN